MKYRKKSDIIEAIQWNGNNFDEIYEFTEDKSKLEMMCNGSLELVIETLEGKMIASTGDFIIKGLIGEFYPCKPDVFLKKYEDTFTMSFGEAIEMLKKGYKLQREGWNGKNQYIELSERISYINSIGEVINSGHTEIGNKVIAFVGTSGVQLGWLASQADMLSEDWKVVE